MFDHVTIRVADRSRSERFFDTVLATLGIATSRSSSKGRAAVDGSGDGTGALTPAP